jgi:hypothetical protein
MAILQASNSGVGLVGVTPNIVYINTNDTAAAVLVAGYLNEIVQTGGLTVSKTTMALVNTTNGVLWLGISITGHAPNLTYSLIAQVNEGAIFSGNVQAGLSGTAGGFISYPATAARGYLLLTAANNAGNTITTITNASQAAARTYTIQDMGANANFCLAPAALVNGNIVKAVGTVGGIVDAGFSVKANTTAAWGGGGLTNVYVANGLAVASIVTASILASTNAASIVKAVPGVNTLTVTFSADPGAATTVNYIAISAAV